jgi:hypothetical protein
MHAWRIDSYRTQSDRQYIEYIQYMDTTIGAQSDYSGSGALGEWSAAGQSGGGGAGVCRISPRRPRQGCRLSAALARAAIGGG